MSEWERTTMPEHTSQAAVHVLEQRAQAIHARLTDLEVYFAEYNALARENRNIRALLQKYEARRIHEEAQR